MVEFTRKYDPVDDRTIDEFAAKYGFTLPEAYRSYLSRFNGGDVEPHIFDIPGQSDASIVCDMFGFATEGEWDLDDLERNLDMFEAVMPSDLLPIARDANGNLIVLGVRGDRDDRLGKVYFWDHEEVHPDHPGGPDGYDENLYLIGDSFEAFLDSLYDDT